VAAAVVVAVGEARGARRLAGFVVGRAGEEAPDPAALKELLASRLPSYMVPSALLVLDELPLSANGKVDRTALGRLEVPVAEAEHAAPRTPLERELAALWREFLGVETVGIDDQLFDLGGNSLVAIQMLGRLRSTFGVEVSLRSLFEAPTVAGLAAVIAQLKAVAGETGGEAMDEELPRVVPAPADRWQPFPLNEVQQAYLLGRLGNLELGDVAAHSYLEIEVETREPERVERAWQRLIERHDMLRVVFTPDGRQRVLAEVPEYRIEILELAGLPPDEVEAALAAVRERLSHQVLPADRWPLFEFGISRLAAERIRIHISLDLLIADAWSSQILLREFAQFAADPALQMAPLELTFRDYQLAAEALTRTAAWARAHAYWQRRLP
ncbi:MAG TPA: non-ribosomal peptide synthetase, partial [Acidobacteria bacterium]|nr:non-ribosomal peptide synthetase [Acidobacteriota bacterium]